MLLVVELIVKVIVQIPVMAFLRRYACQRAELGHQLASFSVHHSRCFCCDNGHVDTFSGRRLECGRELVYQSLGQWFENGSRSDSLRNFDNLVRTHLFEQVRVSFEQATRLHYFWHSFLA